LVIDSFGYYILKFLSFSENKAKNKSNIKNKPLKTEAFILKYNSLNNKKNSEIPKLIAKTKNKKFKTNVNLFYFCFYDNSMRPSCEKMTSIIYHFPLLKKRTLYIHLKIAL